MSCCKKVALLSVVVLSGSGVAARSHAVTTYWNTNFSGSFTTAANWSNGVPNSQDNAEFYRGPVAYTVTFPGGSIFDPPPLYLLNTLRIHTNEVTFADNSSPFITAPSLSVANPDLSIIVGQDPGNVAILNTQLNYMSGANASIGRAPGANGTLNVTSGTFNIGGSLDVGDEGTGTMHVTGGGRVFSTSGTVGRAAGANGTLNVNVGTMNLSGTLYIGDTGTGTLNVTAGGRVETLGSDVFGTGAVIGSKGESNGTVTVAGAGSTWTNTGGIIIAESGTGTVTIQSGGSASAKGASIGGNGGSSGMVTVSGPGSTWTSSGELYVGVRGTGALTVEGGGSVITAFDSRIGRSSSANGSVTVTGAGSTWINNRDLAVGDEGSGKLNITAGGAVTTRDTYIGLYRYGPTIGTGTVTVDGLGSTWTNIRDLYVGGAGSGTLNITSGGQVSSVYGLVGHFSTSVGMVSVDGVGSTWSSSSDVILGDVGIATLTVTNAGTVAASGLLSIESKGTVKGNGNLSGNVINRGLVSPGTSAGVLHINGIYIQSSQGKLQVELGGTVPGTGHDQLQVSGAASLNGLLDVSLINGFEPAAGAAFDILEWGSLNGSFSTIYLPVLAAGLGWDTSLLYTTGELRVMGSLAGDYNRDGAVDAADYIAWRKSPSSFGGDPGGYNTWRAHFGQTSGSATSVDSPPLVAIPETCSLGMLVLAAASKCRWRLRQPSL